MCARQPSPAHPAETRPDNSGCFSHVPEPRRYNPLSQRRHRHSLSPPRRPPALAPPRLFLAGRHRSPAMDALNEAFELDGDADFFLYAYGFAEDANADAAFAFPAGPNAAAAAAAAFAAGPFGAGPFAAAAVPAGLVAGPFAAAAFPAGLVAGPFAAAAFPAGLVAGPFAAAAIPAGHADGDADGDDEDDPNNPWKTVPRRRFRHVRGRTAPLPDPPASPVKICTNAIPWVPKRGNRRDVKKHAQAAKSGFAMSAEGPGHFVFGSFGPTSLEF